MPGPKSGLRVGVKAAAFAAEWRLSAPGPVAVRPHAPHLSVHTWLIPARLRILQGAMVGQSRTKR